MTCFVIIVELLLYLYFEYLYVDRFSNLNFFLLLHYYVLVVIISLLFAL